MDMDKIQRAVRMILEAIGEDPDREGLKETPRRVGEMYREVLSGINKEPKEVVSIISEQNSEEMVLIRDIQFHSLCEHHLLPFFGKVHIAYLPQGKVAGLSKLPRVVEVLTKRLQIQERLTNQIIKVIEETLKPRGVVVVVEAEHLCMSMRGVKKPGSLVVTSGTSGIFKTNDAMRREALSLIRGEIK